MLNLREYRNTADRLADHLPWAALIAPGLVLNKDGSFQRPFGFPGPAPESPPERELFAPWPAATILPKRLGPGESLHFGVCGRGGGGFPARTERARAGKK